MTQEPHPDDAPRVVSHRLRWILIGVGGALLLSGGLAAWRYPQWRANRSITMAREWLDAGKLIQAGPAVEEALRRAPENPEAWAAAAELAARNGQAGLALLHAAKAAELAPADAKHVLNWAAFALIAGDGVSAERALKSLADIATSPRAQLLLAELNRLRGDLTQGTAHLENAVRLGGSGAEYDLPLADALFRSKHPGDRERAREVYQKYRADAVHGASAVRAFLLEAISAERSAEAVSFATELLAHPAHTTEDQDNALNTLARFQPDVFRVELAKLQAKAVSDVLAVDHLLAWLTGYEHHALAADWLAKLPSEITSVPPVAIQGMEHLRMTGQWAALRSAAEAGAWGDELDFLRQAYVAHAVGKLGETERGQNLWRSLRAQTELHPGRGLFLAGTVYAWGEAGAAVEFWWQSSQQAGLALQALGSLARHYQSTGDSAGLLKAFRQLYRIRAGDDAIANNYVYFSALLESPDPRTLELARALHERNADSLAHRATYAFALQRAGRAAEALAVITPKAEELKRESAFRVTCGLVYAANGKGDQAREYLRDLPAFLSSEERALVAEALASVSTH